MKDDTESKRIIRRVGQESEATMATRIRRHMSGADADPDDWVEIWGTRIGRVLSVVLAAVLVWWLIDFIRTL
ncbi:MAG: hypothetical protein ACT6QU_10550 [Aliihoeflea sp.]|uniref:hypothetical protein n=1 Tax=Aliihoeflea sp. TaxID=2608088 RepID=UPI004033332E